MPSKDQLENVLTKSLSEPRFALLEPNLWCFLCHQFAGARGLSIIMLCMYYVI